MTDNMEVSGGEEMEGEFLKEMSKYQLNLDQSTDSLQGSVKLPIFSMDHSTVTDLQGSQGFPVFESRNLIAHQQQEDRNVQDIFPSQSISRNELLNTRLIPISSNFSAGVTIPSGTLIFSHSQISPLNVIHNTNHFQVLNMQNMQPEQNSSGLFATTDIKPDTGESSAFAEVFDGGSSDEKSGKCKISPKRRGRKSRSTSSTGNEMSSRSEAGGPSPSRLEGQEVQSAGEMGFKPSILDEILTEKKLALMKSPQVMQFLQTQQQKLAREKRSDV